MHRPSRKCTSPSHREQYKMKRFYGASKTNARKSQIKIIMYRNLSTLEDIMELCITIPLAVNVPVPSSALNIGDAKLWLMMT